MADQGRPLGDPVLLLMPPAPLRWPLWAMMSLGLWLTSLPFQHHWTGENALMVDIVIGLGVFGLSLFCRLYEPLSHLAYLNAFAGVALMSLRLLAGVDEPLWAGPALIALALTIPARLTPPASDAPAGWFHNPSTWVQRAPPVALSVMACLAARDCRPVAAVFILALAAALTGDRRRWRTAPWAVAGFLTLSAGALVSAAAWTAVAPGMKGAGCAVASLLILALASDEAKACRRFLGHAPQLGQGLWDAFWNGGAVPVDPFDPLPSRRPAWAPPGGSLRRHSRRGLKKGRRV